MRMFNPQEPDNYPEYDSDSSGGNSNPNTPTQPVSETVPPTTGVVLALVVSSSAVVITAAQISGAGGPYQQGQCYVRVRSLRNNVPSQPIDDKPTIYVATESGQTVSMDDAGQPDDNTPLSQG